MATSMGGLADIMTPSLSLPGTRGGALVFGDLADLLCPLEEERDRAQQQGLPWADWREIEK